MDEKVRENPLGVLNGPDGSHSLKELEKFAGSQQAQHVSVVVIRTRESINNRDIIEHVLFRDRSCPPLRYWYLILTENRIGVYPLYGLF